MENEKRLIDANEVLQRNEEAHKKDQANPAKNFVSVIQYHTVKEMVNSSPTVDAVEVVRCKDCKRYCKSAIGSDDCLLLCVDVKPDDYCSHGERKDNDL